MKKTTKKKASKKVMPVKKEYITKAKFEKAIEDTGGIMSTIAKKLGVARRTVYNFVNKYPEFAKPLLQEEAERIKDLAENKVIVGINDGDLGTARWYLSTKAKDRGYGQKVEQELSGVVDNNVKISINLPEGFEE